MSNEPIISQGSEAWEMAQRQARALSESNLVPEGYRKNIPNTLIAMGIASRIGADPLMVMQNLVVIHGRPTWSATFLIATVNQCGRFSPLRYECSGDDPHAKAYKCRAVATDRESGQACEGEWITWKMVDGEGWSKKSGSKWLTMPGQMFRYRAAAFWARVFAPEVSMGIQMDEEARDARNVTPIRATQGAGPAALAASFTKPALDEVAAEVVPAHDAETGEVTDEMSEDEAADIRRQEAAQQQEMI